MPAPYTITVIGKMASTNVDAYLKTVQLTENVENGSHVVLGELLANDLNTYAASTPTDVTTQEILVVENPILVETPLANGGATGFGYDGLRTGLVDPRLYINPANFPLRARELKVGDTITFSAEGFAGTPTVNQYAIPQNGSYKLAPSATNSGATLVYKVERQSAIPVGQDYVEAYRLRVVKSGS